MAKHETHELKTIPSPKGKVNWNVLSSWCESSRTDATTICLFAISKYFRITRDNVVAYRHIDCVWGCNFWLQRCGPLRFFVLECQFAIKKDYHVTLVIDVHSFKFYAPDFAKNFEEKEKFTKMLSRVKSDGREEGGRRFFLWLQI